MLAILLRPARLAMPVVLAAMSIAWAQQAAAEDKVLKVGTLKLIHGISAYFYEKFVPAGYTVEVYPVREPDRRQECGAHRHGRHLHPRHRRVPARRRRRRADRDRRQCQQPRHGGDGRRQHRTSRSIKDLKGKRVAIWPGSTQEAVILERLRMEGMTIKDIQPIRLQFSDMAAALARGDIDAYVGAEPAPGISLANGTGRLVEYPYSTPIGSAQHDPVRQRESGERKPANASR